MIQCKIIQQGEISLAMQFIAVPRVGELIQSRHLTGDAISLFKVVTVNHVVGAWPSIEIFVESALVNDETEVSE